MFITLGKRDDIRIYTITDMIVKNTSLTNAEINDVSLQDKFSFFEVPKDKVDEVLSLSEEIRYKGRRIKIEVTKNPKSPKSDKSHRDSRTGSRTRKSDNEVVINGKAAINRRSRESKDKKDSKRKKSKK